MQQIINLPQNATMELSCGYGNPKYCEGCHFTLKIKQGSKEMNIGLTFNSIKRIIKQFQSGLNEAEDEWEADNEYEEYIQKGDERMYSDEKYDSIMDMAEQMKSLCEEIKA